MTCISDSIIENQQATLFGEAPTWPSGLLYEKELLTRAEEVALLEQFATLRFANASYREWTARRRVVSYGGRFDFERNVLVDAEPLPAFLQPLRERLAAWCGIAPGDFRQMLISEYSPGTPLGWHRDAPCFETVVGVSLGGVARMRWRPYPPQASNARAVCTVDLAPRSAYVMRQAARWDWQHAVSPTKALRYSVTMRTLRP